MLPALRTSLLEMGAHCESFGLFSIFVLTKGKWKGNRGISGHTHLVRTGQKAQTSILQRGVLQGIPKPDSAGLFGIQECAILVRWHGAAYLGLLADDHALQASRVFEPQALSNLRRAHFCGALVFSR